MHEFEIQLIKVIQAMQNNPQGLTENNTTADVTGNEQDPRDSLETIGKVMGEGRADKQVAYGWKSLCWKDELKLVGQADTR